MRQWMLRITSYAERLINELEDSTGHGIKLLNGIGSAGAKAPR